MRAVSSFDVQLHYSTSCLTLVPHVVMHIAVEKRQKVSNAIQTMIIRHSAQLHIGIWISRLPDRNIIVIDIEE
jgi:hypothetical protein